jgi:uncharacterized protein (DUF302 family)
MHQGRRLALSFGVFLVLGLAAVNQPYAYQSNRIDRISNNPFERTVERLKWAFGGYGLTIVATFDYQQILKKLNMNVRRSTIFEVLRRPWAKIIFEQDPAAGLDIPFKVYVYERADGQTIVSYDQPSILFGLYEDEELKAFGQRLDSKFEAIVQSATR